MSGHSKSVVALTLLPRGVTDSAARKLVRNDVHLRFADDEASLRICVDVCRLMVLDWRRGDVDVPALLETLSAERKTLVTLVIVASGDTDSARDALRRGASDVLFAPVTSESLASRVIARFPQAERRPRLTPPSLLAVSSKPPPAPAAGYCTTCFSLRSSTVTRCDECDAPAPDSGWPPLVDCPFPDLGRRLVDRYVLERYLGGGGGGGVYRAQDLFLRRRFAVKRFDRRLDVFSATREVERLARVRSAHVVQVFELHRLADDQVFAVMEYAGGAPLDQLLSADGPLSAYETACVGRQIALALTAGHAVNVVHRDVKPANVMLTRTRDGGVFARLLDYGVAFDVSTPQQPEDGIYGSPRYAAPEQLLTGSSVQRQTDLFGLGMTLVHLFSGRTPSQGLSMAQLAARYAAGTEWTRQELWPGRPPPAALADLVDRLLVVSSNKREADAELVARELRAMEFEEIRRA
ncbi:MAG: CheY-like chemotaxis protein [Bradymonadia bacterium]|jgi:CheY-like chemotaxis protein